jgi:hypothetical protein
MNSNKYKNQFVIVYDTLCDGNICVTEGEGDNAKPCLFDSYAEAMIELFDSALSMIEAQDAESLEEIEITQGQVARMKEIDKAGDATLMEKFLEENPQCNYNNEWVQIANEFILHRKAIFTSNGLVITGKKLE